MNSGVSLRSGVFFLHGFEGLPVPQTAFASAAAVYELVELINQGKERYGNAVTIAELVGAGVFGDFVVAVGAVGGVLVAGVYAGAAMDCAARCA